MGNIKIILADDHTLFREGLRRLLENEKDIDCVAVANDGDEAVRMVERFRPDVVLMDVSMPGVDGIEATRQIRDICPDTAVLVVSAHNDENYIFACIQAGIKGYLLKTVRRGDLVNAIRLVRNGESVFDSQVTQTIKCKLGSTQEANQANFGELNTREIQVLRLAAKGMSNKEIAGQLKISTQTVGSHFINIFKKLGVESRMKATSHALKQGWLTIDDLE